MIPRTNVAAFCRNLKSSRISSSVCWILRNNPSKHIPSLSRCTISSYPASGPLKPVVTLCGESGRTYTIQEVLKERLKPLLCVYLARTAEGQEFIIKNLILDDYEYQQELQKPLFSCPNLWTVVDGLPGPELFIYPFFQTDFLQFTQKKNLTDATRKSIIKSALAGLASMHDRNIIHTDIKPDNILLDYEDTNGILYVKKVQIADLEDATILLSGKCLRDTTCGNPIWRSPESWAQAKQGTSSDIFSFGIVAIYIVLKPMVFRAADEKLGADDTWWHVLTRHINLFATEDGFKGLLHWIGDDNPFFYRLIGITETFTKENIARTPFDRWLYVDAQFRDLVGKMTNLDPAARITARDALEHPWFEGVEFVGL